MNAKDYRHVGNALRYKFTSEHPSKPDISPEYMPSILAISADVIDLYHKSKSKTPCKMAIVNCGAYKNCGEDSTCVKTRIFYLYHKGHCLIFHFPEELDEKLRIDNQYPMDKGNPICELYANAACELAFQVFYRYYEVIPWSQCYWPVDYYEDILATIFLFCPEILCYAIKNELQESIPDIHVKSAIRKCLDFSVPLDKYIEEEKKVCGRKEHADFYNGILNEINSFHILRDVEIALTEDADPVSYVGDIIKKAMDVSSKVVSGARKVFLKWSEQGGRRKFERDLKRLIGSDNYNYIYGGGR